MKLKKIMKWNPVTEGKLNEISVEQGLKDVSNGNTDRIEGVKLTSLLAWEIQQWIKMSPYGRKYAKHINKGRFGSLLPILNSQGFADRLNGANLRNWQTVVKKHLKESNGGRYGDATMYSWGQINKALMKQGMSPKNILKFNSILKKM